MEREYKIFNAIISHYNLADKFCINGFGDGKICVSQEGRNYTVKEIYNDKITNATIHNNLFNAFVNALKRIKGSEKALDNFRSLCSIFN